MINSRAKIPNRSGTEAAQIAETIKKDGFLRILVKGPDFDDIDKITEQTIMINLGKQGAGTERLSQGGLLVRVDGDKAIIDEPLPGTPFFVPFQTFDFMVMSRCKLKLCKLNQSVSSRKFFTSLLCYS